MTDRYIDISTKKTLVTHAREVARYIVSAVGHEASLHLTVENGAGVHLVVPHLFVQASYSIVVKAGARLIFSLFGATSRPANLEVEISLTGEQAKVDLALALVGSITAQSELKLLFNHQARATSGRISVRRVLCDEARSRLKGLLYVGKEAHLTDTYLSDKSLLVGERTEAITEPQLEILADDVKASHGATIGRLAEEERFYLRSRGLPKPVADSMLVQAFLSPAMVGVPEPIKQSFLNEASIGPVS